MRVTSLIKDVISRRNTGEDEESSAETESDNLDMPSLSKFVAITTNKSENS